jgi:hypothetical protein
VDFHPWKSNLKLIIALPEQHYTNPSHTRQLCLHIGPMPVGAMPFQLGWIWIWPRHPNSHMQPMQKLGKITSGNFFTPKIYREHQNRHQPPSNQWSNDICSRWVPMVPKYTIYKIKLVLTLWRPICNQKNDGLEGNSQSDNEPRGNCHHITLIYLDTFVF